MTFWWKMTLSGRQPLVEEDHWMRMTFPGRQPKEEDDFLLKTTFVGRRPKDEEDFLCKTTFVGRQPTEEDNLRRTLHAAYSALYPNSGSKNSLSRLIEGHLETPRITVNSMSTLYGFNSEAFKENILSN